MTWQDFVDDLLMGQGVLQSAAILGHDGGVYARSTEFPQLSSEEVTHIMERMAGKETDLSLGGQKYYVIEADIDTIRGKGMYGGGGCMIMKTCSTLVVGISLRGRDSECSRIVKEYGDYLISEGR